MILTIFKKNNSSFKWKRLVYHVGIDAGFYSEFNNMVLAIIYAFQHKIRFTLYSTYANFGTKLGWEDYFLPFCEEIYGEFHRKHNRRGHTKLVIWRKIAIFFYRLFHPNTLLTQDIWSKFRNEKFANAHYSIPELGVNGSLREACQAVCRLVYRYNPTTAREVNATISSLNLPSEYISMQIRGGDKYIEAPLLGIEPYIKAAEARTDIVHVFILTDDYRTIEAIRKIRPNWTVFSFCLPTERGYYHELFHEQNKNQQEILRSAHIRLFASLDVITQSALFVGTFSANPGMFAGMRMDPSRCVGVDVPQWFMQ